MHAPTAATVSVDAVGTAWIEGTLYVRTITRRVGDLASSEPDAHPTQLVLRERGGERTIVMPNVGASPTTSPAGGTPARVESSAEPLTEWVTESRLDPRHVGKSGWLPDAVWDVHARVRGADGSITVPVATELEARPALVAGRPAVAYQNNKGHLTVDTTGRLRFVVNDGRPRLGAATVTASDGRGRRVRVTMPLDGVRVHGRGSITGSVTAVPYQPPWPRRATDVVRRRLLGRTRGDGSARITATRDDLTLEFDVTLTPGRWRPVLWFAGGSKPAPFVLTVPRSGAVTIEPLESSAPGTASPLVTVVAAGRDDHLLEAAVRSVVAQAVPADLVEVVVVGGTSGATSAWVARLATAHPNVRVVAAPSGSSAQRNAGLESAGGRYVFFVDADDRLTPDALERLIETAEATGADVVLGTVRGITRRKATPKAFTATVLDADFVDQRLFDTLTPYQLFRRQHLVEHGLRFSEDIPGTTADALFAAEAELNARRVVTLADLVYYERFVSGAATEADVTSEQAIRGVLRLAETFAGHVEAGPRRDTTMRGPAAALMDLVPALSRREAGQVDNLATEAGARFGPYWTEAVRAGQDGRRALLLDTLLAGDGAALTDLLSAAGPDGQSLRAVAEGSRPHFDVPPSVQRVLDPARLAVPATAVRHLMTSLEVHEGVAHVAGWVAAPGLLSAPDGVQATLLLRGSEDEEPPVELPVVCDVAPGTVPDDALGFTLRIDPAALPTPGRWDLYVAPVWSEHALPAVRFGSRRPTHVDEVSVDVTGRALGSVRTVLYATATYGNLSVSHEDFLQSDDVDVARLATDDDGRPEIVFVTGWRDSLVRFDAAVEPCDGREAPHRLPWRRLDGDGERQEIAVRLPVPAEGELQCVVSAAHKEVQATVRIPDDLAPVRSEHVTARCVEGRFVVSRHPEKVST